MLFSFCIVAAHLPGLQSAVQLLPLERNRAEAVYAAVRADDDISVSELGGVRR